MPRPNRFRDNVDDRSIPCRLGNSSNSTTRSEASSNLSTELFSKELKAPRSNRFRDKVNDRAIPCRLESSCGSARSLEASPNLTTALFSKELKPPREFGSLSVIHKKPRGPTPRDGEHNFIFVRPESDAPGKPGINDAINHPGFEAYYNFEGRKIDELSANEKRTLEMAIHYPNIRGGIMKAPLYFRAMSFAQPQTKQSDLLCQVFGTTELFDGIVSHIIPRIGDLTNLCRTSQFMANRVQAFWMHLDATGNDFLKWDERSLADVRGVEAEKEEQRRSRTEVTGNGFKRDIKETQTQFFSPSVIISPVRPQTQGPQREVISNRAGYPLTSSVEEYKQTAFATSLTAHYKMLHLVFLNGQHIKHLMLHSMPWIDLRALRSIIPQMVKLEVLGIHQCFLLTLGDTQPLLQTINAINDERAKQSHPHVAIDFTPFYYKGPPYKSDGTGHIGEYGIVPEEKDWLDSHKAITAQLLGIRDLCHKGGHDLFTPGTGFRAFLDRLPVRTMSSILKCIEAIHDYKAKKYHSGVGVPQWCTSGTHYSHGDDMLPLISEDMKHAMEVTLFQDLIVACNGREMLQEQLKDLIILRGKVKLTHCVECNQDMPASFFMANVLARRESDILCHGCQLTRYLSKHNFRLYKERRALTEKIFMSKDFTQLPLTRVLRNISKHGKKSEHGQKTPCRPGMVDLKFFKEAAMLWNDFTIAIPELLKDSRSAIDMIDDMYGGLSYDDKLQISARRNELERDVSRLEFELGINQRNQTGLSGSLERVCRSWELDIRDYRAELAIEKDGFSNLAPIPIFNFRSNVASMLGSSGGLPEYWNVHHDPDENDTPATSPTDSLATPISSVITATEAGDQQPSLTPPSSNDSSYKRPDSPDSSISSRLLDNSQIEAIQQTPPLLPAVVISTPCPTSPRPRNRILRIIFSTPSATTPASQNSTASERGK
ncbi:hypothetical protein F5B22DRAFT_651468 [Xylaria bambusicola]|uniref:uncharacterized protein n=1 Tax=Xylaria bambusicola TaxID=326684 RepID=UPI00200730AB|nr:uncharacterized protein F5B22DRAFT_651468 [Xylaria bambusicola]KAI0505670.1 hypothetical protein F5B22DRAFT_651468 [Xylaria bambusicola]